MDHDPQNEKRSDYPHREEAYAELEAIKAEKAALNKTLLRYAAKLGKRHSFSKATLTTLEGNIEYVIEELFYELEERAERWKDVSASDLAESARVDAYIDQQMEARHA